MNSHNDWVPESITVPEDNETLEQYIRRELKVLLNKKMIEETGWPFLFWEDEVVDGSDASPAGGC